MSQSRTFSAIANSVASTAKPKKIAAQPGPGNTNIANPATTMAVPTISTRGLRMGVGMRFQVRFNASMRVLYATTLGTDIDVMRTSL